MGGTEKRGGQTKILRRGGQAGLRGECLKKREAGTRVRTMDVFQLVFA